MKDVLQLSDDEIKEMKVSDVESKNKVERFTKWKKEPKLEDLKHDLQEAQSSHSQFIADLDRWEELYNAPRFTGNGNSSKVNPKLVRKQAEWRCSALSEPFLSTSNLFDIKGVTHDDVGRAKQNAMILNMQFNTQMNKVRLVDSIVRHVVKEGTCIARLGWEERKAKVKEKQKQFKYTEIQPPMPPMQMGGGMMGMLGGMMGAPQLPQQPQQPQDPMQEPMQEPMMGQIPPEAEMVDPSMAQDMGMGMDMGIPPQLPPPQPDPMAQEYETIKAKYDELAQLRDTEPDSYEALDEALKAGFEMSEEQGILLVAKEIGEKVVEVEKVVVNKPTVEVCNLRNVYIDPTCNGLLEKAQFIIHSYESSLADLQTTGLYKNLDDLTYLDDTIHHTRLDSNFKFKDKARKKLVVYEYWGYWDIHGTGELVSIVASWIGSTLIRLEENPFPDKKPPFVVFNYIPEPESIYGIPDAELLEDNQLILGAVTRGVIDLMGKSANSQTGYMKGLLDPTNKKRFINGDDYEFNPVANPASAIFTHKYPEVPNSAMNIINMMNGDAEAISGIKAFNGSGITSAYLGDTAAGARGVLDAVSKREMTVLRRLSEGFIQMGRKIISMNGEWLSEKEVVRVTNTKFITVRRDDLLGQFDLSLTISTAEADDSKAKELAYMLQTMGNNLPPEMTNLLLSEIANLRKMPDLAHMILNYKPEPDETAQKLKELEIERLQAEIELLKSQAQENMAKAEVQSAKVGTEQAKSSKLQSEADNKALDFVERDNGTRHQREMEKQMLNADTKLAQQDLANQGKAQISQDNHNAKLLQQFAQEELMGLNQPIQAPSVGAGGGSLMTG